MSGTTPQAAYVLHYTPWRDTSFIVDAFTLERGRVGLVARGARRAAPRTRALYQPFRPLLVSWVGEGELRTLAGIEESGPPVALEGAALACGYYANELVLRLLGKDEPQPELFAHYALALASLAAAGGGADATDGALEAALRTFELQLLEALGLLPDLARAAPGGAPIEPGRRYRFHPVAAVAVPLDADAGVAEDAAALAIPKRAAPAAGADAGVHPDGVTPDEGVDVSGRTLLDMAVLDFAAARTREEAKALMRRLVALQLGGRPLRSRSMFEALVPPPPATGADGAERAAGGAEAEEGAEDGEEDGSEGADG